LADSEAKAALQLPVSWLPVPYTDFCWSHQVIR
jgi:hypothetical protein